MSALETAWTVVGIVVSVGVGVGFAVLGLAPPEFKVGRVCFSGSAVILAGMDIVWDVQTGHSFLWRLIVSGLIGATLFVLLPGGLRFITRREGLLKAMPPERNSPTVHRPDGSSVYREEVPKHVEGPKKSSGETLEAPPLRRPPETQAAMLKGLIDQMTARTKVREMWLSQVFKYQLDNVPDGPEVDVPKALRDLAAKHEVQILQTAARTYQAWWGESFREDIRFTVRAPYKENPAQIVQQQGKNNIAQIGDNNKATIVEKEHLLLDDRAKQDITEALRPFAGHVIKIFLNRETVETSVFGIGLADSLRNAGIDVPEIVHIHRFDAASPRISLIVSRNKPDIEFLNKLTETLTDKHIATNPVPASWSDNVDVSIIYVTPLD